MDNEQDLATNVDAAAEEFPRLSPAARAFLAGELEAADARHLFPGAGGET